MQSFFAMPKSEYFYLNKFDSVHAFRESLVDHIHFYSHDRIKLKY